MKPTSKKSQSRFLQNEDLPDLRARFVAQMLGWDGIDAGEPILSAMPLEKGRRCTHGFEVLLHVQA